MQIFDGVTTSPHGVNPYIVCESEMLIVKKYKDFMYNDKNHVKETNTISQKWDNYAHEIQRFLAW